MIHRATFFIRGEGEGERGGGGEERGKARFPDRKFGPLSEQ
jgi:hypothetical protein